MLGILGRDGAFADYLRLPERNLITVGDSIPDELAVFVEPVAAAYEIFEQIADSRNHARAGSRRRAPRRASRDDVSAEGYDVMVGRPSPGEAADVSELAAAARARLE